MKIIEAIRNHFRENNIKAGLNEVRNAFDFRINSDCIRITCHGVAIDTLPLSSSIEEVMYTIKKYRSTAEYYVKNKSGLSYGEE